VKTKFTVNGVTEALRKAKETAAELSEEIDKETEKAALRTVNEAAENAPRKDGHLINSIVASPKRKKAMVWEVGSDRPYAARQEYEHKTRKGFFRKALLHEESRFKSAIEKLLRKVGGKG
jgi:hypothetical protein